MKLIFYCCTTISFEIGCICWQNYFFEDTGNGDVHIYICIHQCSAALENGKCTKTRRSKRRKIRSQVPVFYSILYFLCLDSTCRCSCKSHRRNGRTSRLIFKRKIAGKIVDNGYSNIKSFEQTDSYQIKIFPFSFSVNIFPLYFNRILFIYI
jgi:hypothetical protein